MTGDYKTEADSTCEAFEQVRCDTLITECTFGLPIYRWPEPSVVRDDINQWWRSNRDRGVTSVLLGYSLGKAQRLIAGLDPSIGPIYCHHAVERMNNLYREQGRLDAETTDVENCCRPAPLERRNRRDSECAGRFVMVWSSWADVGSLRQRLDGNSESAPPARVGSRVCRIGPRRLAVTD